MRPPPSADRRRTTAGFTAASGDHSWMTWFCWRRSPVSLHREGSGRARGQPGRRELIPLPVGEPDPTARQRHEMPPSGWRRPAKTTGWPGRTPPTTPRSPTRVSRSCAGRRARPVVGLADHRTRQPARGGGLVPRPRRDPSRTSGCGWSPRSDRYGTSPATRTAGTRSPRRSSPRPTQHGRLGPGPCRATRWWGPAPLLHRAPQRGVRAVRPGKLEIFRQLGEQHRAAISRTLMAVEGIGHPDMTSLATNEPPNKQNQ